MIVTNTLDIDHPVKLDEDGLFKQVFRYSEIGLILIDADYCMLNWNPWFSKHSGVEVEEVAGKKLTEIFSVINKSSLERAIKSALKDGMSSYISYNLNRKPFPLFHRDGKPLHHQITVKPLPLESQQRYCLIQITNVSTGVNREKQLIEQSNNNLAISEYLAQEKERAQVTLESIADGVITTDKFAKVLSMNSVAESLTGVIEENAVNVPIDQVFRLRDEKTHAPILCPVRQSLIEKRVVVNDTDHVLNSTLGIYYSITDSVAPIIDAENQLLGAVLVFRDVTQSRLLSAELNWQALHDPLTGLSNRRQFELKMKELLVKARLGKLKHHLLYLDLDQFKVVNDTCGHDAGDELLKQVTVCLEKIIRKNDLLARLGGDEFGILLESCDAEHALVVANNLRQAVENFRFGWQTHSFKIGVSVGIAEITGDEVKASEILSAADAACYTAKEMGRNRVHFHELNASASSAHQKEMQWISRLQAALDEDSFELYLQRIQPVNNNKQTDSEHYEVLLRMIGTNGEIIPPGAFLPAAERFNLIGSVDRWVVNNIFKKLQEHVKKKTIPEHLILSINLSGATMADEKMLETISCLLEKSGFPAEMFCFEVTETAAITNLKQATHFLSQLRFKGCKVALDDFGSGLSSFAYLKDLPIDYLKIDGYFVKDIVDDSIDKAFVEAINQISQVMGLETIAEFVENDAILNLLSEIGVNYAQGYGIHKPCSIDDVFNHSRIT